MALPSRRTEETSTSPERLTRSRTALRAEVALTSTRPPWAWMAPPERIAPPSDAVLGARICMKPAPEWSSVIAEPVPSATRPAGTTIVPALSMPAFDNNPTKPPGPAEIVPSFDTTAPDRPENISRPAMKSLSATSSVEATKPPPIRTAPSEVMAMPFGLTR